MFNFLSDTKALVTLRNDLEKIFSKETAYPSSRENPTPSAGHCAVVACMIHRLYPVFDIVSTVVTPIDDPSRQCSHWLNALRMDDLSWFVDLTGDQFGYPKIQIFSGDINDYRIRSEDHIDEDTQKRLELFCQRYQALDGSISFCV